MQICHTGNIKVVVKPHSVLVHGMPELLEIYHHLKENELDHKVIGEKQINKYGKNAE